MCSVPRPNLARDHRGTADLIDRRDPLPAPATPARKLGAHSPTAHKKANFEHGMTGVKLYPDDALRLRALKQSRGLNISKFCRDAIRAALRQAFAETKKDVA